MKTISLFWSRRDFRLRDNPALAAAARHAADSNGLFLPLFVIEDYMTAGSPLYQFGAPQRSFLAKALPLFAKQFKEFLILSGKGSQAVQNLVSHFEKEGYSVQVYANDDVHPDFYRQVARLRAEGVPVEVTTDQLTVSKDLVTSTGSTYSVFTPFKKAAWSSFMTAPLARRVDPQTLHYPPKRLLASISGRVGAAPSSIMALFSKARTIQVAGKRRHTIDLSSLREEAPNLDGWYFDEDEALRRFDTYLASGLPSYAETRDSLELDAGRGSTSRMSLALAWGLVSARTLRSKVQKRAGSDCSHPTWNAIPQRLSSAFSYLSELMWREFYKYLLYHNPSLLTEEFQERFRRKIAWVDDAEALRRFRAWIRGETGYDIVDAAMTQLAQTGWMHNRARMIVASVLTKNLGVDWRWGQEYFRAQLVDLDEASNNGGWQWGASVGADPKPIRIFNPYLQAESYDASGAYRKKWLAKDPSLFGTRAPIVEHKDARADALARYGLSSHKKSSDR